MSALLQTLIGAAASIAGGMLAVRYQQRRMVDLTARLRRAERGEEALVKLDRRLAAIQGQLGDEPANWGSVTEALEDLEREWRAEFDLRITNPDVREKVEPVRRYGAFLGRLWDDPNNQNQPDLAPLREDLIPALRVSINRALG